jgi:hypothetical protein
MDAQISFSLEKLRSGISLRRNPGVSSGDAPSGGSSIAVTPLENYGHFMLGMEVFVILFAFGGFPKEPVWQGREQSVNIFGETPFGTGEKNERNPRGFSEMSLRAY